MAGLPAFFQTNSTTVLDELTNFDLGDQEDALDALIDGDETGMDGDTFGDDTFGDLKEENLPDFFATPKKSSPPPGMSTPSSQSKFASFMTESDFSRAVTQGTPMPSSNKKSGPPPGLPPGLTPAGKVPHNTPAQTPAVPVMSHTEAFFHFMDGAEIVAAATADDDDDDLPPPPSKVAPATPSPAIPAPSVLLDPNVKIQASYATLTGTGALSKPLSAPPSFNSMGNNASIDGPLPAKANFGRGKYMSHSDVRFVVSKVLQPLESSDPYSDDFYFLQYNIKKNLKAREEALRDSTPPPPMLHVPLPTWKETKERIKLQLDSTRKGFEVKVKEWEEKEQVLGHRIRPEISKPREQLSLPSIHDLEFDDDDDNDGEWKAPFASRLWTTRLAVQQGFEALYAVQELQHLMSSPLIATNAAAMEEIRVEMEAVISLLSQSLGIRSHVSTMLSPGGPDVSLDGRHVAAILQTVMGKKLLSRGLKLLSPAHRWTLVPVVLARVLMTSPSSSGANHENMVVERKLLKTIIEYLQYSYQHHREVQTNAPGLAASAFSNELLRNLRLCVKNVMITQMEKNQLRESLLSERTRAEIMHVVVQVGDEICSGSRSHGGVDQQLVEEWTQTRDAFMSFLDN